LAQKVIAPGLRKVRVRKFIADVKGRIVGDAVPFASNVVQRVPGGVFEEHAVETVEAILVVDISPDLTRVGMLRCGDRADI